MALNLGDRLLSYTEPPLFLMLSFLGDSPLPIAHDYQLMYAGSISPSPYFHRPGEKMGGSD